MDLLKGLVDRLETVAFKLESMASGKPESISSADGESRAVAEFTQLMDGTLADFVNKGSSLDEPLPKAVI